MMLGRLFKRDNETTGLSITDWARLFKPGATVNFQGRAYQGYQVNTGTTVTGAGYYDSNSVVFACEANRLLLFSEARFQYQRMRGGRPAELWGDQTLSILEEPWPGHSTRDLLAQAELDIFAAGNSYWVKDGIYLLRLAPDKVTILTEAVGDPTFGYPVGQRLLGYAYRVDSRTVVVYPPEEVAHYMPYPDLVNRFRGKSWLSAAIADVDADAALTDHKNTAIGNVTQIPYVVTTDPNLSQEQFEYTVEFYRKEHAGPENAGKTLFLSGGADIKTVGQSFEQLSMKATQGAGETRISAASGVPPVIVGLSEGLSSATYSNYGQARRRLVDGTMRPLWGFFAAAMQSLLPVQSDSRLWYDDRDIPFLREDVKDQAAILGTNAATVVALIQGGYTPDAVVKAVQAGDLTQLTGNHTGLFSVQLQPPGIGNANEPAGNEADTGPAALPAPAANGASNG